MFSKGKKPTESDFAYLIENCFNRDRKLARNARRIWRTTSESPVYSSPVVGTFSDGTLVVATQNWDWYGRVINAQTGELIWSRPFSDTLYGRAQIADVNGDGKAEVFFASHAGEIRCYAEDNTLLWEQYDEYTVQGSGTVESATAYSITDTTKKWAENSFIRNTGVATDNAILKITEGTGAGQEVSLSGVEATKLWTADELNPIPDATSKYEIVPRYESDKVFQHAGQLVEEEDGFYLYTVGFDMICRKIDAKTGNILWRFSSHEANEPYPLIVDIDQDGELECMFSSVDGYLYCLNAKTGEQKWKADVYSADAFLNYMRLSNGELGVVCSSRDHSVYVINGKDGSRYSKTTDTTQDIDARPVVYDFNGDGKDEFIFNGDAGDVYCCNEYGETLWKRRIGIFANASPVMADINNDGKPEIAVSDMSGTITFFNGDGDIVHEMHMQGAVEGTPIIEDIDGDGRVEIVVTTLNGHTEMYRFE